jgi:hypothetical protein
MTKAKYISAGLLKNTIWLVRSQEEWEWLKKKYKWMKNFPDFLEEGFAAHRWAIHNGRMYSWIQIDPKKFKGYTCAEAAGVVSHECLHCVQRTIEWMGDAESTEWEAYYLDWLVCKVFKAVLPKIAKKKIKA